MEVGSKVGPCVMLILIIFFKVTVSKLAVVNLVIVENLSHANSLTYALMKELPWCSIKNSITEIRISQGLGVL